MTNRAEALAIVQEYVKNKNLVRHMLAVEAAMRFYAEKFGEDLEIWGVTGLLHDFDWEIHPTLEEHPQAGTAILHERGVPEVVNPGSPQPCRPHRRPAPDAHGESALCLRRDHRPGHRGGPGAPITLAVRSDASSVKKKWKDRAFAAGANREEIEHTTAEFGIELWEHVDNVILAMRRIAPELGFRENTTEV